MEVTFRNVRETGGKLVLPSHMCVYEGTIRLTNPPQDAHQSYWGKLFRLRIVEALPGAWLSKITDQIYGKPLQAQDPSVIFLYTLQWAEFFDKHAMPQEGDKPSFRDFYKKGNVPGGYAEELFEPNSIYPGQRFFLLEAIEPSHVETFEPAVVEGTVPPDIRDSTWVGVGVAEQTDWVVVGQYLVECWVHNIGRFPPRKSWHIQMDGFQFGLGFGVSGGLVLVVVFNVADASLLPAVSRSWDFQIAIGAKLTGLLKSASFIKTATALTKTGRFLDRKKYSALKYLTEAVAKNRDALSKPSIVTLPIPLLGAGAHVWGGYKFGDVRLLQEFVPGFGEER